MPIYEYECMECGEIEEVIQKCFDKPLSKCNHCSGKLQKLISQSTFHLKGTGWYVTDYANKSKDSCITQKKKEEKTDATATTDNSSKTTNKTS
ncbi:MAG: zinc ribbon domain-containing protein [Desulfobacterales bacterium]|nr:zinc ribbon domain-containing protein [Desulfobacterales bacterium]